jgi:hypothetical protein
MNAGANPITDSQFFRATLSGTASTIPKLNCMRLIIAEDEALLALCITDAVEDAGHHVLCCEPSAIRAVPFIKLVMSMMAGLNGARRENEIAAASASRRGVRRRWRCRRISRCPCCRSISVA